MKTSFIAIFITLIAYSVYPQTVADPGQLTSSVDSNIPAEQQAYQMITPLLMREVKQPDSQDEYAIRNGSKFNSFFSSLIIPGSGQVKNRSWWRAGLFFAIETTSIYLYVDYRNNARTGERNFEKWTNRNWSVVQYSKWLVNYHKINGLDNPHIDQLESMVRNTEATFNIEQDWEKVELEVLRNVERNTPYITPDAQAANNFSHVLPDYGSQQYYELVSKYFQYQSGWRDYNNFHDNIGHTGAFFNDRFLIDRGGAYASPNFYEGARMADRFNSDFRRSGYIASVLIANHVLSAFDAYFTLKVKQNKLQATSSIVPGKQVTLTYQF